MTMSNKIRILIFLGYSYKNLIEVIEKMPKRKKSKKKNSSKLLTYIAWILAIIALSLSALVGGYYMGYSDAEKKLAKQESASSVKKLPQVKKTQTTTQSVQKRLKEVLKKDIKTYTSASHEITDDSLANPPKQPRKPLRVVSSKPKLAIIIDDVSTASQVRAIHSLHIPLTMSFLPPSAARPNSAKIAAHESFYMVHLPMEAMNFSAEEPYTMRVHDSQQEIYKRVKDIKKLFPKVAYINNHTGSKFTSNEVAMNRLIYAFNKNGIHFIDSRTTAETKAPKVLKNFGLKYVARDVFLDHHSDKEYIKEQIKKAIEVAKKHGSAIAIGHPHKTTLEALSESKRLFSDVDLVRVNRVY